MNLIQRERWDQIGNDLEVIISIFEWISIGSGGKDPRDAKKNYTQEHEHLEVRPITSGR